VLAYGLASLLATLFYLAYWFTGSYGLGFGAVHFFKMWFPLWTIAATAAVVAAVRALAPQRAVSRRSSALGSGRLAGNRRELTRRLWLRGRDQHVVRRTGKHSGEQGVPS
jgi:hypothetical protein